MRKLAIAVCYFYEEKEYLSNDALIPIQVGYNETHIEMGIQKDCEGDNRGSKHPFYSELSGLYWIWKNVDAEYKGLFHHRRALTLKKESLASKIYSSYRLFRCMIANVIHSKDYFSLHQISLDTNNYYLCICDLINSIEHHYIGKVDIIVPKRARMYPFSMRQHYSIEFSSLLFQILDPIIMIRWPQFYEFWCKTLNDRTIYYGNISIMRSDIFDDYCSFLFDVLDSLEHELNSNSIYMSLEKEKSMSRKFGYVGELLTNTYVLYSISKGAIIEELYVMVNKNLRQWVR